MAIDIGKSVSLSFEWLKSKESWRYALLVWAAAVLVFLFSWSIAALFFPQWVECLSFGYCGELEAHAARAAFYPAELFSLLLGIGIFSIAVSLFGFFAMGFVNAVVQLFALRSMGFKNNEFFPLKYLKFLALLIAAELAAWFWSFDKRLRIVQWLCWVPIFLLAGLALFQLPSLFAAPNAPMALVFLWEALLAAVLFLPVAVIAVYNAYRLFAAVPVFLHKESGVTASLKKSWKLMEGNVLMAFIASIVIGIAMLVVLGIAGFFVGVSVAAVSLLFNPGSVSNLEAFLNFVGTLSQLVLLPAALLINSFFIAGIYSMVLPGKKKKK